MQPPKDPPPRVRRLRTGGVLLAKGGGVLPLVHPPATPTVLLPLLLLLLLRRRGSRRTAKTLLPISSEAEPGWRGENAPSGRPNSHRFRRAGRVARAISLSVLAWGSEQAGITPAYFLTLRLTCCWRDSPREPRGPGPVIRDLFAPLGLGRGQLLLVVEARLCPGGPAIGAGRSCDPEKTSVCPRGNGAGRRSRWQLMCLHVYAV